MIWEIASHALRYILQWIIEQRSIPREAYIELDKLFASVEVIRKAAKARGYNEG